MYFRGRKRIKIHQNTEDKISGPWQTEEEKKMMMIMMSERLDRESTYAFNLWCFR